MKRISTYCFVLLLAFVSLTLNHAGLQEFHDHQTHISASTVSYEFVLVRETQIQELAPQIRVGSVAEGPVVHQIIPRVDFFRGFIHKSNVSFMARRNCVCVPMRC